MGPHGKTGASFRRFRMRARVIPFNEAETSALRHGLDCREASWYSGIPLSAHQIAPTRTEPPTVRPQLSGSTPESALANGVSESAAFRYVLSAGRDHAMSACRSSGSGLPVAGVAGHA